LSDKHHPIRSIFSSVNLTIALLIVIAVASILGTLIPQQEAAEVFAKHFGPGMLTLFQAFQLFDIFHSAWFLFLMVLLAINLIVCSWRRCPVSWRGFRGQTAPDPAESFRTVNPDSTILTEKSRETEEVRIESFLKKRYSKVERRYLEKATFFHAEKGVLSHFGVYAVHLSVLIIMAGVIVGFLFGFDASVNLVEGQSSDTVLVKGGKGERKLDFTVRCDRFSLESYENGAPKLYRSDLTFSKGGHVIHRGPVLVNHPVSVEGIRFYQANYGIAAEDGAVLAFRKNDSNGQSIKVAAGADFVLPGTNARVRVLRTEDNLMGSMGPAVKIEVVSPREKVQFWVFQQFDRLRSKNPGLLDQMPIMNPARFLPWVFSMESLSCKYYTGLQVSRDPGAPIVAVGAVLLVFGFMAVFFYDHRRILICVDSGNGKTRITVTGRSNKNPVGLEQEIRRLLKEIHSPEESPR
jgi:cytochrome c biogenesis protein